jgi:hypothetical protein
MSAPSLGERLEEEIDGFLGVVERLLPRVARREAAGQVRHDNAEGPRVHPGFDGDEEFHDGSLFQTSLLEQFLDKAGGEVPSSDAAR